MSTRPWRTIDCDETADIIASSGIEIWAIHAINVAATVRYLKIYDTPTPIVGTTVPVLTLAVPTSGGTEGSGFTLSLHGMYFASGAAVACVVEVADAGTTGAGANEVLVNVEIS